MHRLPVAALFLVCGSVLAQVPQAGPPPTNAGSAPISPGAATNPGTAVDQTSRVRAFDADAGGAVQSVYLSNGSVVDLSQGFGPNLGPKIHKGARIHVEGLRRTINGQQVVSAQQLTVGGQSFTAGPGSGPAGQAGMPPPPGVGEPGRTPGAPTGPRPGAAGGPEMARRMPPPPPPGEPAAPPPPPPPAGVNAPGQIAPPPPPPAGSAALPAVQGGNPPAPLPPPTANGATPPAPQAPSPGATGPDQPAPVPPAPTL